MANEDRFTEKGKAGEPLTDTCVIDTHAHLGPFRQLRMLDGSIDGIVGVMDRLGVDLTMPSATMACLDGVIARGNDLVIDAVRRFPDRIRGYISVNPAYPQRTESELKRCWDAGLRAIKVHNAIGTPYDDKNYEVVWKFAARNECLVLAHAGGGNIKTIEPQFDRYPRVHWILAHAGISQREEYVRAAREHSNVYVDLVYSACPRGLVEYLVKCGIEDRVLWGTDVPFMSAQPQLGRVIFADISVEQKEKILGLNARALLEAHDLLPN